MDFNAEKIMKITQVFDRKVGVECIEERINSS
jgi:hypothetical protein